LGCPLQIAAREHSLESLQAYLRRRAIGNFFERCNIGSFWKISIRKDCNPSHYYLFFNRILEESLQIDFF